MRLGGRLPPTQTKCPFDHGIMSFMLPLRCHVSFSGVSVYIRHYCSFWLRSESHRKLECSNSICIQRFSIETGDGKPSKIDLLYGRSLLFPVPVIEEDGESVDNPEIDETDDEDDYIVSHISGSIGKPPSYRLQQVASKLARSRNQRAVNRTNDKASPEWWGDYMRKETEHCRFLFQNVNGISRKNGYEEVHKIGESAKENGVGILGLAETNKDWHHQGTRQECSAILRQYCIDSVHNVSSSSERSKSAYQPGGTLTVVGEPWASRAEVMETDKELGRWNTVLLNGQHGEKVAVVTAYRVVKNSIDRAGPASTYAQQWRILKTLGRVVDPRVAFFEDLESHMTELKRDACEVVVMLDANESLQYFSNDFTNWARDVELVDIHVERHGTEGEPPTHLRGSDRIDYILMTKGLTQHVKAAGIPQPRAFHPSDHRAVYVDIDLETFLSVEAENASERLVPPPYPLVDQRAWLYRRRAKYAAHAVQGKLVR
jgi:hypothetical protein